MLSRSPLLTRLRFATRWQTVRRFVAWGFAGALVALFGATFAIWLYLRGSLPQLDGQVRARALPAAAVIERDAAGNVSVRAADEAALAYATGYAHGQDRFFQMDILRRLAAGELAALLGPDALPVDRQHRVHRFRARARAAFAALDPAQQAYLRHYAAGVNAAVAAPLARPFEYALLRGAAKPWSPCDSLLVVYAMYLELQGSQISRLLSREALRRGVAPDMLAFLTPAASAFEAPLDGGSVVGTALTLPAARPEWLDRISGQASGANAATWLGAFSFLPDSTREHSVGSNAFAVGAAHGRDARARVANDMHLALRLPNTWYRLTLSLGHRHVSGVSLPGAPVVVAGSNGDVAWGFTNSYGRLAQLVALDRDAADPALYRGPDGRWLRATAYVESLEVAGAQAEAMTVLETVWGPVIESAGRVYALRWMAHQPGAVDMGLRDMAQARDAAEALRVARSAGVPAQNILVADRAGRIGWTIAGPLPWALPEDDGYAITATQADRPWQRLPPRDYPRLVDPALGRLWSGNSRALSEPAAQARIGEGGADAGARSRQIRDALLGQDAFDEARLLAIQLDDRGLWLDPWRAMMLESLDAGALRGRADRVALRRLVQEWDGRADAQAVGYTLVRDFRQVLYEAWFGGLDARLAAMETGGGPVLSLARAPSRIEHTMQWLARHRQWVPARHGDWQAFMLVAIDAVIARNTVGGASLEQARWGDRNELMLAHPFAPLLPAPLRRLLMAPAHPMPGDIDTPRVQRPSFGASQRFVVAPGHEEAGILHMPGGASGHPLSPFYLAGHDDWRLGRPAPFLPGPAAHRLQLVPAR